jgi:hypothetical protein
MYCLPTPCISQILAKIRVMRTLLLLVIFCSSFSLEATADYFKWEILFAEKGFGTEFETIPLTAEGKVAFTDKNIECRMESFWTRMEADLLLEGKTLVCVKGDKENSVSVVCRDNNLNRKYNLLKELYPVAKAGFRLLPKMGSGSAYLLLRCYF